MTGVFLVFGVLLVLANAALMTMGSSWTSASGSLDVAGAEAPCRGDAGVDSGAAA